MTSLRGITWEHPRGYDCVVAASKRYAQQTGIDVAWEHRSLQAFADAPIERLAADYDLLVIDHPHIPLAAESGAFAQFDGHGFDDEIANLASQSVGDSHKSYAHNGHQYALATDAAAQVAVFRPDLLSEPPRNWDEVLELARSGRVLWPSKPIDALASLVTMAANDGNAPGQDEGIFLRDDHLLSVLERMHELAALVPEVNLTQNPIQVAEMLSTTDDWLYAPLAYGYTNYSRAEFRQHRIQYTDIPQGRKGVSGSQLGGAGIAVSATASDLDASRAFALWLAAPEVQSGAYYDAGGQPANAVAWDDDRLNADSLNFFRGTRATLEGSYVRPRYAGYIEFQDSASVWVNQTLRRELTDAEVVRRMNAAAAELLTGGEE